MCVISGAGNKQIIKECLIARRGGKWNMGLEYHINIEKVRQIESK